MNAFTKEFFEKGKPIFTEQGFICYKGTFVKLENGIVKCFGVKNYCGGFYHDIEFGLSPLCSEYFTASPMKWQLTNVYPDPTHNRYRCLKTNDNEAVISRMIDDIQSWVIPLFKNCTNTKKTLESTYQFMLDTETRFEGIRSRSLGDIKTRTENRYYLTTFVFYLALKAHDYNTMREYVERKIQVAERFTEKQFPGKAEELAYCNRLKHFLDMSGEELDTVVKEIEEENISQLPVSIRRMAGL